MRKSLLSLVTLAVLLGLTSCASKPKTDGDIVEPVEPAREAKKDYEVLDFSDASTPSWVKHPSQVDLTSEERALNRYFISEGTHSDQRLCVKSAEARATAKIASEIAQFMKNTYAEATQGGPDEQVTAYMQEQLAQDAQSFLVGVQVAKTYWEKRKYMEKLGATEDKTKFYCYAVAKMDRKQLETSIKKSTDKLLSGVKNPEVKQKTEKILKDVGDKFAALDSDKQ